jgi:hypothetical protein
MSYQDNVRAAAAALKRGEDANWELARLTYETCGAAPGSGGWQARAKAGYVAIQTWANDVANESGRNFSYATAAYYRDAWALRQTNPGRFATWSDAYSSVRGGTVGERMVEADFNRALAHATPEQKRDVFQRIVREEPAVVQQAWQDTDTNVALSEARWQAHQEQIVQPAREKRAIFEPTDTTLDRTSFFYDIQKKVDQWARELDGIRDFLANAEDVNLVTRKATRNSFELLIHAAEQCRDTLPSSRAAKDDVVESTPHRRRGVLAG